MWADRRVGQVVGLEDPPSRGGEMEAGAMPHIHGWVACVPQVVVQLKVVGGIFPPYLAAHDLKGSPSICSPAHPPTWPAHYRTLLPLAAIYPHILVWEWCGPLR